MRHSTKAISIFLIILCFLSECASYQIDASNSRIPIYFQRPLHIPRNRLVPFHLEAKLTWAIFDTINIQDLDLEELIQANLPNAEALYEIRIRSEENPVDSIVRFVSTFIQLLFVADRPFLFSRRTVIIEGYALMKSNDNKEQEQIVEPPLPKSNNMTTKQSSMKETETPKINPATKETDAQSPDPLQNPDSPEENTIPANE